MTVKTLGKKLSESIIGVLGSAVYTVNNLGNTFFGIILILNSSAIKDIISFLSKYVNKNSAPRMKCGENYLLLMEDFNPNNTKLHSSNALYMLLYQSIQFPFPNYNYFLF